MAARKSGRTRTEEERAAKGQERIILRPSEGTRVCLEELAYDAECSLTEVAERLIRDAHSRLVKAKGRKAT